MNKIVEKIIMKGMEILIKIIAFLTLCIPYIPLALFLAAIIGISAQSLTVAVVTFIVVEVTAVIGFLMRK